MPAPRVDRASAEVQATKSNNIAPPPDDAYSGRFITPSRCRASEHPSPWSSVRLECAGGLVGVRTLCIKAMQDVGDAGDGRTAIGPAVGWS
jgi:hypothetical protein